MTQQKSERNYDTIVVELKHENAGEEDVALGLDELVQKSKAALDNAMGAIQSMSRKVAKSVKSMPIVDRPDIVEVEFGLKLSSDSSAVVVSAGVEAQINVSLVWDRSKEQVEKKKAKRTKK